MLQQLPLTKTLNVGKRSASDAASRFLGPNGRSIALLN